MRMGRRRVWPLAISASSADIPASRRVLAVSTSRMALLTTMPSSMRKPSKETSDNSALPIRRARKEPIRAKGTQSMTSREKRTDSNCMAMTRKTRKRAMRIERNISFSSSLVMFSTVLETTLTDWGNSAVSAMSSTASLTWL